MVTVELWNAASANVAAPLHSREDLVAEGAVLIAVGRVVVVEVDPEVGEVAHVLGVTAGDQRLRLDPFLARPDHDRRTVGVVRADVDAGVAAHLLEAHPEIGLQILHQVPDVDGTVGIGQGGRDDDTAVGHSDLVRLERPC